MRDRSPRGLEPGRAETLVNLLLVTGVDGVGVTLHSFDELTVGAVAQQLENLGKKSLVLFSVTLAPVVCHLIHEPAENLAGLVLDGSVHRRELETAVEIPSQEGAYSRIFFADITPNSFDCSGKRFRPLCCK